MILQVETLKTLNLTHMRVHKLSSLTIRKLVQLGGQGTEIIMAQCFLGGDPVSRKALQHLRGQVFGFRNPAQPGKVGERN